MPSGDIADLGSPLARLLLWSGGWALLGALVVGALLWTYFSRRATEPSSDSEFAEPSGRRFLRLGFGLLWIADGLLQAQPRMPAGFVPADIDPQLQAGPDWLASLVAPLLRAWTRHPVVADVAVVWLEIGIGLLLLLGRRGVLARIACVVAIVASVVIWVLGECFGGLLAAGASWLTGAPGAALVYALAAALLLVPVSWWRSGHAQVLVSRCAAGWLAVGAVLQAVPAEGFWTADGLAGPFSDGAAMRQPGWLSAPMRSLARVAGQSPGALNLVVVLLVSGVAVWLWFDGRTAALSGGIMLCLATWWLAQDFGVLGGTATDPNTGLPLALLIAAALPAWSAQPAAARASGSTVRTGARAIGIPLAAAFTVVVPAVLAIGLARPADSAAVAADSGGGLRLVPARAAPAFALTDQRGRPVSTSRLRGKVVLLTFLDPVCTSDCPLIANQLAIADRRLGSLAEHVEIVAIDSNPLFYKVADVAAFTASHGLSHLSNWHFVCGPPAATQDVLGSYGISVGVPTVGMIEHSEGLFFIRPDGTEAAYLDDHAGEQLTETYAQQVQRQLQSMLP